VRILANDLRPEDFLVEGSGPIRVCSPDSVFDLLDVEHG